jgi:putative (di)nucleoside polyphosphate hydrolase
LIDRDGFRPNVGIILSNDERRLFWGRRIGQNAWQFPQGGINTDETPAQAMYRELEEEVGLEPHQVTILGATQGWLRYHLPKRFIRRHCGPTCIGQKQVWFLLRVDCQEEAFCLDKTDKPEFDAWRWVRYWQPLHEVVYLSAGSMNWRSKSWRRCCIRRGSRSAARPCRGRPASCVSGTADV